MNIPIEFKNHFFSQRFNSIIELFYNKYFLEFKKIYKDNNIFVSEFISNNGIFSDYQIYSCNEILNNFRYHCQNKITPRVSLKKYFPSGDTYRYKAPLILQESEEMIKKILKNKNIYLNNLQNCGGKHIVFNDTNKKNSYRFNYKIQLDFTLTLWSELEDLKNYYLNKSRSYLSCEVCKYLNFEINEPCPDHKEFTFNQNTKLNVYDIRKNSVITKELSLFLDVFYNFLDDIFIQDSESWIELKAMYLLTEKPLSPDEYPLGYDEIPYGCVNCHAVYSKNCSCKNTQPNNIFIPNDIYYFFEDFSFLLNSYFIRKQFDIINNFQENFGDNIFSDNTKNHIYISSKQFAIKNLVIKKEISHHTINWNDNLVLNSCSINKPCKSSNGKIKKVFKDLETVKYYLFSNQYVYQCPNKVNGLHIATLK